MGEFMVDEADLILAKSLNHPPDDISIAGGAIALPFEPINNSFVGEWLTRSVANPTGVIDVDTEIQYQKAFYVNNNLFQKNLLLARIYLRNLLIQFDTITNGQVKLVSSQAADDNTKRAMVIGQRMDNSQLGTEEIVMNGTTEVSGIIQWLQVFRLIYQDTAGGFPVTVPIGNISVSISDGTNPDELLGIIPSGNPYATSELEIGLVSSTNDTGQTANRRTAPAGINFSRPNSIDTAIPIRNDLSDSELSALQWQGIWIKQTLQPGMTPVERLIWGTAITGEST